MLNTAMEHILCGTCVMNIGVGSNLTLGGLDFELCSGLHSC